MAKKMPNKGKQGNNNPKPVTAPIEKKENTKIESISLQTPTVVVDVFEAVLGKNSVFLVAGLLLLLLFILFGSFMFDDRLFLFKDLGSDTTNIFYPQLVHVADYLSKEGLPKWSFNQGMGQNLLPMSIGDPFNWILYAMGKANLAYGIVWVEFLKLFAAGMLFYGYLRSLSLTHHTSIIGGIAYAFCGFMVVGSGWYVFSTQGVYIAMLLWGFERLFQHKSWWMFSLSVFLISLNFPFDLYLAVLLIFFYSTMRLVEEYGNNIGKYFSVYFPMLAFGALGVLMSMCLLVSSVDLIINSPRVSGESSFFAELSSKSPFSMGDKKHNLTAIARLFSNDILGNAGNNDKTYYNFTGWKNFLEAPALYSGLFTLLLLPQAFVLSRGRKRMLYAVGLAFVVLPIMFPYLRYAFWLFSGDYYRNFSLYFTIAFLFVGLHALDLIYTQRKVNLWVLALTFLFLIFMLFVPFADTKPNETVIDGSLRNIIVMFLLAQTVVIAGMGLNDYRHTARIAFIGLVALESLLTASYTFSSSRPVVTKTEFKQKVNYNDYTVDAVAILKKKDPSFYRISKYYQSGPAMHASSNDAKVQDYFGTPSYHSFNQKNYIRFLSELNVIDPKIEDQTRWAKGLMEHPLLQIIASNKYILEKQVAPRFGYVPFDSVGDVKIMLNQNFLPLGFTYDKVLNEALFQNLSREQGSLKKQVALFKCLVVDAKDIAAFQGLQNFDTTAINVNYTLEELGADVNALRAQTMEMTKFSQSHITGKIKLDKPKALFFSIPFDPSWTAKVDGKAVKLYRANLGLMALPLTAGEHNIELQFTPPYWGLSWMLSGLGFLIFGALLLWGMIRKGKKKLASEETTATTEA